jgi:ferric-dicitrate binding protein FerR (iron transport regulator)
MKTKTIQLLIDKYYNGNTSEKEEIELMELLKENNSENFVAEKAQFLHFTDEKGGYHQGNYETDFLAADQPPSKYKIKKRGLKRLTPAAMSIAASVILAVSFFAYYIINYEVNTTKLPIKVVSLNEVKSITLPDQSVIWLNKQSQIVYPEQFSAEARIVKLTGEAYFEITQDPTKPFIVESDFSSTEVLGTAFNVRSYPEESTVSVLVNHGKVAFSSFKNDLQEKVFLVAGNLAIFDKKKNTIRKFEDANTNMLAWKTKKLIFDNDSMESVLSTLSDYYGVKFESKYDDLLNCSFSGAFHDDNIDDVLDLIAFSMNLQYEKTNNGYILTGTGCPN